METFVAKQPIFDRNLNVFAYELLFRSGLENACHAVDLSQASSKIISDALHLNALQTLTGGRPAFINVTRDILLREFALFLPSKFTVIEIPETINPDSEVLAACEKLKKAGFLIALDDFVYRPEIEPLVRLADFVKVDILQTQSRERQALVRRFTPFRIRLVAEKVETRREFEAVRAMGYSFFQGYFFAEPIVLETRDIPGSKLQLFRILQEIHHADLDFDRIEEIIKQDLSLCYKFLRYINSAYFGIREKIRSIRHALVLLGEREFKKWVSLVAIAGMGEDKPQELVVRAVERAKFYEALAPLVHLGDRSGDLFLMGMFSLIDAVLDRPLAELLDDLPIAQDIKSALLGTPGPLRDIHLCLLAYERGDWPDFAQRAAGIGISEEVFPPLYWSALAWSRESIREPACVG